jgi:hypothetical protein
MKSYTSLYPSPDKDYTLFNEASGEASLSSLSSLGGLGDNHGLKKYDDYVKTINNETQQKREINQKSVEINLNRNMLGDEKKVENRKPCNVNVKNDSGDHGCFSCFTWCK